MTRPSFDQNIMDIARVVAERATCDRKHVGAVIVHDKHILSTGFNGSLPGQPHCDDIGHDMEDGHCVRTVHAEANAILAAARHGVELRGSTIYTTASPCSLCFPHIVQAGITCIVYGEVYRDYMVFARAEANNIQLRAFPDVCTRVGHHEYAEHLAAAAQEEVHRCRLCGLADHHWLSRHLRR